MLIVLKDDSSVDDQTQNLINFINSQEGVWDSNNAINAEVITDNDLYDASEDEDEEGISECQILIEAPNADHSLMLIQDEDDEDIWYVAVCNCCDEEPRVIDRRFEINESSDII